jgi:DNA-binding IclR family transcriptional regulator
MARPAPAATRALLVLDLLASASHRDFTLAEIARQVGMSTGTAHAILHAMSAAGYVTRRPDSRRYVLGPVAVAVGQAAAQRNPAIAAAREELARLAREVAADCALCARVLDEIVILERVGRPNPHRPLARVGQRFEIVPPVGTVWNAWSSRTELDAWLARAEAPGVAAEMAPNVELVRELGFALVALRLGDGERDGDGPTVASVRDMLRRARPDARFSVLHVVAPVFDATGAVALVMTAEAIPGTMTEQEALRLGERVREAGLVATRACGGRLPESRGARPA